MPSSSARQWWRRAAAKAKDQRSICLARVAGRGGLCNPDIEAAVIRATSHDEASLDYKNARRVFRWARAAPSSHLHPLMWSLASRASRTRSWAVALKCLLLAHGLLLASPAAAARLPFDLSDFRARSPSSWGFSAFVRAYFNFLDNRSIFLARHGRDDSPDKDDGLHRVENLQSLLDLLMQIRPYADGMEVGLILEAMDCAMLEIFEVYSGICNGIACFLVGYMGRRHGGGDSSVAAVGLKGCKQEERRQRGLQGIKVLKRAAEQSDRLSAYFDLCRRLGVLNAAELPPVEKIPDEDIVDLEKLVMGYGYAGEFSVEEREKKRVKVVREDKPRPPPPPAVVTESWVVFEEEETVASSGLSVNPFDDYGLQQQQQKQTWASMVHQGNAPIGYSGDLIEL